MFTNHRIVANVTVQAIAKPLLLFFYKYFFTAVMKGLQVPSLKGFIGGDLFAGGLYFDT